MPQPVWIILANGARARLLQRDRLGTPLHEVMDWVHPQTRQHLSSPPGEHRTTGIRGRSGLALRQTAKDHERSQFAQEICQWLDKAVDAQGIGAVAVFASNPFLGELMSHHNGQLQRRISVSHPLDLTHLALHELDRRLQHEYQL